MKLEVGCREFPGWVRHSVYRTVTRYPYRYPHGGCVLWLLYGKSMGFKHAPRDKFFSVVELDKAGKTNREMSVQTGVNEKTVSRVVAKLEAGGGNVCPLHTQGGGKPRNISTRSLVSIRRLLCRCYTNHY